MKQLTIRSISLLLAVTMVLLMIPTANAYGNLSPWAEPEVSQMEELGLIPESLADADLTQDITRLEMCRIAVLSYETLTGKTIPQPYNDPFLDTTDADVEKAFQAGLVKGRDDGKFYPDANLTRIDFFAFVSQFLTAIGYPASDSDYGDLSQFPDAETIPEWALEEIDLVVGLGVVKGNGEGLGWANNTTAEQAIAMFFRAYNTACLSELNPPEIEEPMPAFANAAGWAMDALEEMDGLGLIPENVKFSSMTGPITRADMCRVAMLAFKELMFISDADLGPVGESPFRDTSDIDIVNAYRLEIVSGDGDGTFRPNDPISRQEYFKIVSNFLSAIGYAHVDNVDLEEGEFPEGDDMSLADYPDSNELSDYAVNSAKLLTSLGIVNGDENKNLHPTDQIVCQEALAIFHRVRSFVNTWVAPSVEEDERDETDQSTAQALVEYALTFVGKYPYIYAGESPEEGGFDCSGLVQYVYKQFGYNIQRSSRDQWNVSDTVIPREELLPGDIIYFSSSDSPSDIFHVALYIGDNQIVHASTPKTGIIISDLSIPYYVRNYLGAKRVIN